MKKWIIALIIFGMLGYAIYSFVTKEEVAVEGVEVGNVAPDFELQTLEGETVKLSDFRGEKVFLNFWASWCGPCRSEMPDMQKFHEEHDDVTILAVNLTQTETKPENVDEFLEEFDITFPILKDENSDVATMYNVQALPTSYLIDSEGKIEHVAVGALNYESMVDHFSKMN